MERIEVVQGSESGPPFDMYRCGDSTCARKAVVLWEPKGGMNEDQANWIQQEISRRGAFFPSDYTGRNIGRFHR
jgi:hypothetical protein